jgi:hypothetical protein
MRHIGVSSWDADMNFHAAYSEMDSEDEFGFVGPSELVV